MKNNNTHNQSEEFDNKRTKRYAQSVVGSNNRLKLLVTGASGFIGKTFIQLYNERYRIIGYDRVKCDIADIDFILDDIANLEMYRDDLSDIDGIIHLAAVSRVITAEKKIAETWETNVGGMQEIINFSSTLDNPPFIIFGSSREVYGEPQSVPVKENHPCRPINRYGKSKLAAEELLQRYHRRQNVSVCILRFSNVYGNLNDYRDRVIPKFIGLALDNHPLPLQGRSNSFDFTHISDTIRAIHLTIENISSSLENLKLNICTGIQTSLEQLAERIITLSNSVSEPIDAPPRDYDVNHFQGDYQQAHDLLGYYPEVDLDTGLHHLIKLMCEESDLQQMEVVK